MSGVSRVSDGTSEIGSILDTSEFRERKIVKNISFLERKIFFLNKKLVFGWGSSISDDLSEGKLF